MSSMKTDNKDLVKKDRLVSVRFKPDEYKLIAAMIKGTGIKVSTYVRTVVLKDVHSAFPADPMAQMKVQEQIQNMGIEFAKAMMQAVQEEKNAKKK